MLKDERQFKEKIFDPRKANYYMVASILLLFLAEIILGTTPLFDVFHEWILHPYRQILENIFVIIGLSFCGLSTSIWAAQKGYSKWWGLLGYLFVLGLFVLYWFPNKNVESSGGGSR